MRSFCKYLHELKHNSRREVATIGADRVIPKASMLRAWRRIGMFTAIVGGLTLFYVGFSHINNWLNYYTAPTVYNDDGSTSYLHPLVEWWVAVPLIIGGIILNRWCANKYHYWYRWVRSGEIVDKNIIHYSEYSVAYTIYLQGMNRAGSIATYPIRLSHGKYEQTRIGDPYRLSE